MTTTVKKKRVSFAERLEAMGACPESIAWVGRRSLAQAWRECPRYAWMLWLLRMTAKSDAALDRIEAVEMKADAAWHRAWLRGVDLEARLAIATDILREHFPKPPRLPRICMPESVAIRPRRTR